MRKLHAQPFVRRFRSAARGHTAGNTKGVYMTHLPCAPRRRRAAVCSCRPPPRPSAAVVPVHLRWGTRSTHSGVLHRLTYCEYSHILPRYCEYSHLRCAAGRSCHSEPRPSAAVVPAHLRWGARSTHSGVFGVRTGKGCTHRWCSRVSPVRSHAAAPQKNENAKE